MCVFQLGKGGILVGILIFLIFVSSMMVVGFLLGGFFKQGKMTFQARWLWDFGWGDSHHRMWDFLSKMAVGFWSGFSSKMVVGF